MKIEINEQAPYILWRNAKVGQVYLDFANMGGLVAICMEDEKKALCIRHGGGIRKMEIWAPGPESKWVHKPNSVLTVA